MASQVGLNHQARADKWLRQCLMVCLCMFDVYQPVIDVYHARDWHLSRPCLMFISPVLDVHLLYMNGPNITPCLKLYLFMLDVYQHKIISSNFYILLFMLDYYPDKCWSFFLPLLSILTFFNIYLFTRPNSNTYIWLSWECAIKVNTNFPTRKRVTKFYFFFSKLFYKKYYYVW